MGIIKPAHSSIALTSSTARIEVPFIKVKIGDYVFGTPVVYANSKTRSRVNKLYMQYPNFIRSLTITKINGQVNQYNLSIVYPIRPGDDPNYFEKIFSSVSDSRKITFSYGDYNVPDYTYKDEVAIMTKISSTFDPKSAIINYTVEAVSSAAIAYTCSRYFPGVKAKPSDLILDLIVDKNSHLTDLFTGLSGLTKDDIKALGLIDSSDARVELHGGYYNELDYIKYLVDNMIPNGTKPNQTKTSAFYVFTIHDEAENDTTEGIRNLNGPYFRVKKISQYVEHADAYTLDIGYPSANIITDFRIDDNEAYSIYFNYHEKVAPVSDYVKRLNDQGEWEDQYVPTLIAANSDHYEIYAADKAWWSKVTQYPISGSVTMKGLLRPAVLMEYLRLNVIFHGRKHVASGLYIITKQVDQIDMSGYRTTLSLTRIGGQSGDELDPWYSTGL